MEYLRFWYIETQACWFYTILTPKRSKLASRMLLPWRFPDHFQVSLTCSTTLWGLSHGFGHRHDRAKRQLSSLGCAGAAGDGRYAASVREFVGQGGFGALAATKMIEIVGECVYVYIYIYTYCIHIHIVYIYIICIYINI